MNQQQLVNAISDYIVDNPTEAEKLKTSEGAKEVIKEAVKQANLPDTVVYRIVVGSLGAAIVIVIVCVAILAGIKVSIPDGLIAIGAAAVGGLAGVLTPVSSS